MAAESLRIVSVADSVGRDRYPQTLFASSDAYQQACTARSTIYCANVAAGMMVGQLGKWLRGMPLDFDVSVNTLALEVATSA